LGDENTKVRYQSSLQDRRHYRQVEHPDGTNEVVVLDGSVYLRFGTGPQPEYYRWSAEREFESYHGSNSCIRRELPRGVDFLSANLVKKIAGGNTLTGLFQNAEFNPIDTAERNGRTGVEFELDEIRGDVVNGDIATSRGSLFVGSESVVHRASVEVETATGSETNVAHQNTFHIQTLGSPSVSQPEWIEQEF
jgi:hypothetical protein